MAANENKPRSWTLVPERLKRLAKGVAKSAVSVMSTILGPFRKLKDAVADGVPVLEGATRDGKKIFLKRGDISRAPLITGNSQQLHQKPKIPTPKKPITNFEQFKRNDLFEIDPTNPKIAKIKQKATGITEKTAQILKKEEVPAGKLPRVGMDIPERERERPKEPSGNRHSLPLSKNSSGKIENTMFSKKESSSIQKDMDALGRGEGIPVKIKTSLRNGRQTPDVFGFVLKRPDGKVRIYGMERNGEEWRVFPVAGDDFLCLNGKEYKALSEMLFDNKTIEEITAKNIIYVRENRFNLDLVKRAEEISREAIQ